MAQPAVSPIRPRLGGARASRLIREAATLRRRGESDYRHGLSDPQSRIFRLPLLPQPPVHRGGKPAPFRQVQQPQRTRPQLHPGSHGEGRSGPALRLCGGFETVKGNLEPGSAGRPRPPLSQQGGARVRHPHSHHREHRHLRLAALAVAAGARPAAPCAGVRNARPVRGLLRRMKAHLTRRYWFSASHRLHSDAMSEEENRRTYGKCNNPHGHGHNYALEVTVSGPVDQDTGMVCNLVDLDEFVHAQILERFGHENLNTLQAFRRRVPTTENLCREIFEILQRGFTAAHLEKVRLEETMMNSFEYAGEAEVRR